MQLSFDGQKGWGRVDRMKKVLSLDLGLTTGFVVLRENGDLVETGEIAYESISAGVKALRADHLIAHAVAERPVIVRGPLGDKLENVILAVLAEMHRKVELIYPSQWKPTRYGKIKCPPDMSVHQRDAFRIGMWYLGERLKTIKGIDNVRVS